MIITDWIIFKHGIYRLEGRHMVVHANFNMLPKGYIADGNPVPVEHVKYYKHSFTVRVKKSLKDDLAYSKNLNESSL